MKKILSIMLCIATVITVIPFSAFAANENIVDLGDCGLDGDNLQWTFYDSGELVISGEGRMDWYLFDDSFGTKTQPWYDYFDEIQFITVEEGVTSIGPYAFRAEDKKSGSFPLCKISLPKSLEAVGCSAVYRITEEESIRRVVCYPDDELKLRAVHYEYWSAYYIFEDENKTLSSRCCSYDTNMNMFFGWEMYYNGGEPDAGFTLSTDETVYLSEDKIKKISVTEYYFDECANAKIVWSIEGDGNIEREYTDAYGIITSVDVSVAERGSTTLRADIVSSDGVVVASDSVKVTSKKLASGDSLPLALEKIGIMFSDFYWAIDSYFAMQIFWIVYGLAWAGIYIEAFLAQIFGR